MKKNVAEFKANKSDPKPMIVTLFMMVQNSTIVFMIFRLKQFVEETQPSIAHCPFSRN